jgi:sugar/nucleoside kinase (ribokinase family)
MALDLLTMGEALVEVMRTDINQPLNQAGLFIGPYPSGAPIIFAAQAARLGLGVGAIGSVGNDAFGECLLNQLEEDGITKTGIRILKNYPTGLAFVAYNADGTRNFVFSLGAGGQLSTDMLNPELFEELRCLHLMGSTLSISQETLKVGLGALQLAQENGAKFSFDPNLRPELLSPDEAKKVFKPFIEAADVLIPTEDELMVLTESDDMQIAVDTLLEQNPERIIVITQGAEGCTVFTKEGSEHVAGFSVEEIDPTGAGDCFDAGFLAGCLQGLPVKEAAQLANACGALAVTKQGPMAGAEKMDRVREFIAEQVEK